MLLQKETLNATGVDIPFTYSTKEILTFEDVQSAVAKIIEKVNKGTAQKISDNGTAEQI